MDGVSAGTGASDALAHARSGSLFMTNSTASKRPRASQASGQRSSSGGSSEDLPSRTPSPNSVKVSPPSSTRHKDSSNDKRHKGEFLWGPQCCRRVAPSLLYGSPIKHHKLLVSVETSGGGWRRLMFGILLNASAKSLAWIKRRNMSLQAKTKAKVSTAHFAAFGSRVEAIKILAAEGLEFGEASPLGTNVLHFAAMGGNLDTLKWFCANLDVRVRHPDGSVSNLGKRRKKNPPMVVDRKSFLRLAHFAAAANSTDILNWLISFDFAGEGVLDAIDDTGCTALHFAAESGSVETCTWIASRGIRGQERLFARSASGANALHFGVAGGCIETCKWLRNRGIPLSSKARESSLERGPRNPLHIAAESGDVHMARWLLKEYGATDHSCAEGGMGNARHLAQALSELDWEGHKPVDLARKAGNMEIAGLLTEAARALNARSDLAGAAAILKKLGDDDAPRDANAAIALVKRGLALCRNALLGNPATAQAKVFEEKLSEKKSIFELLAKSRTRRRTQTQSQKRRARRAKLKKIKSQEAKEAERRHSSPQSQSQGSSSNYDSSSESSSSHMTTVVPPPAGPFRAVVKSMKRVASRPFLRKKSPSDAQQIAAKVSQLERDPPRTALPDALNIQSPVKYFVTAPPAFDPPVRGSAKNIENASEEEELVSPLRRSSLFQPVANRVTSPSAFSFASYASSADAGGESWKRRARLDSMEISSVFAADPTDWKFFSKRWAKRLLDMVSTTSTQSPSRSSGIVVDSGIFAFCPSREFRVGGTPGDTDRGIWAGVMSDGSEVAIKRVPAERQARLLHERTVLRSMLGTAASAHLPAYRWWSKADAHSTLRGMDCAHLIVELCETSLDKCVMLLKSDRLDHLEEAVPPGGESLLYPASSPRSKRWKFDPSFGAMSAALRRARRRANSISAFVGAGPLAALLPYFADQLFMAASAMHEQGWVHCDINPAHVLITRSGVVKLSSFGSCRPLEGSSAMLDVGSGTIGWRPGELVAGDGVGESTDTFGVALVCYYILSAGFHAFGDIECDGADMSVIEKNIISEGAKAPPMTRLNQECSPIRDLLVRGLSPKLKLRPSCQVARTYQMFWTPDMCYEFLCIVGNQNEVKSNTQGVSSVLPNVPDGRWFVVEPLWRYVKEESVATSVANYDTRLTSHLLRFIRNTSDVCGHRGEMPRELRRVLEDQYGSIAAYFVSEFRWLVVGCWRAARYAGWHQRRALRRFYEPKERYHHS